MGNIGALSRCHARHGDPGAEVRCGIISRGVTIRADREKLCVNSERESESGVISGIQSRD